MFRHYDITDYLKDDKELQKAVIEELLKELSTQQGKLDAYQMSENEANEIIAELKAYKDVNEDFKTAWEELKAENDRLEHLDEEINDFISDISTCGFKYDDRCPDNLDELQCCIEDLCNKFSNYKQTLQEIKAIAAAPKPFIDFSVTKTATEVKYDYAAICNELELRLHKVLELITKAEEE